MERYRIKLLEYFHAPKRIVVSKEATSESELEVDETDEGDCEFVSYKEEEDGKFRVHDNQRSLEGIQEGGCPKDLGNEDWVEKVNLHSHAGDTCQSRGGRSF